MWILGILVYWLIYAYRALMSRVTLINLSLGSNWYIIEN